VFKCRLTRILRGASRAISRIKTFDLRRANFALFKELLGDSKLITTFAQHGSFK